MKHVNTSAKIVVHAKKDYNWNPSTCISQNGKYLKSIADILVIACDEIVMLWILCQQISRVLLQ